MLIIAQNDRPKSNDAAERAAVPQPEHERRCATSSGIPVEPFYLPDERTTKHDAEKIGLPGEYPYTRGIYPRMYREKLWTMRQYAGFGTPEQTNRRLRYLWKQGQNGLSLAFDLPTQIGYDPDHPLARAEVGKVGVSVCSLLDMETLLRGIPLQKVSTSITINAPAPILLAMYIAAAEKRGISADELSGTIQNDILKEFIARGTAVFPPEPSMRLVTDTLEYCTRFVPRFKPISISGYHMREAGANAVQEVAFAFSNAIAYVNDAVSRGLAVDRFAPNLTFFFSAHSHFFEEIAKFRAARRLWARMMRERFRAQDPRSCQLRFHTQTAGSTLTAEQADNNIARVAIQALSAVLGGTQSLHTNAKDEAIGLPTEASARTALRIQQIIAFESGTADSADPLAGSYYIESLTDEIERRAMEYIGKIDAMGGAVQAAKDGYMQQEIRREAYAAQLAFERGERIIVGVNRYRCADDRKPAKLRIGADMAKAQAESVARLRLRRDSNETVAALAKLDEAARRNENIVPAIIAAVKSYATIGEMCDVLRGVFGEYASTEVRL